MGGGELNEILEEFFAEADENLDTLEQDLIKLEALADDAGNGETDQETVDRIFRMLHTLKGSAGFLGFENIAGLAHAGENLLDGVRDAKVTVSKPVMDALLLMTDTLKLLLETRKKGGDGEGADIAPLVAELEVLAGIERVAEAATEKVDEITMGEPDMAAEPEGDEAEEDEVEVEEDGGGAPSDIPADEEIEAAAEDEAEPVAEDSGKDGEEEQVEEAVEPVRVMPPVAAMERPRAIFERHRAEQRAGGERRQGGADRRQQARRGEEGGAESIRVEVERLDAVMDLAGEVVLARNALLRQLDAPAIRVALEGVDGGALVHDVAERLRRVTQDLQAAVLSTRMQPVKRVFDKIPRQVRDLKDRLGKAVNLVLEGEATEVDRNLVEELADPLMHLVSNALDHGLESPAAREAAGKPAEGTLVVRAFYEGNSVVIQVQDDGRGIDPARIRKAAVAQGLVTREQAGAMSDAEAIRLIMAPGFSTADAVTDLSGRGVGMDVVQASIARARGGLSIVSEPGVGTCFSIQVPLTLAIVNALIVGANAEGFAIPLGDIAEVVRLEGGNIRREGDRDVVVLRGEALPLYRLGRLTREGTTKADGGFVVVVREGGGSGMGLVVDALLGQEEVVVKPLSDAFAHSKAVAGATITGDGAVRMILDMGHLLREVGEGVLAG